jgi:hypothetical protein
VPARWLSFAYLDSGRPDGVRSWWAQRQARGAERLALRTHMLFLATEDLRMLDASLTWHRRAVAYPAPDDPDLDNAVSQPIRSTPRLLPGRQRGG